MNYKSIVYMFFLALMTCPSLIGMIRRTAVAPKVVPTVPQVILPASFSQLIRSYSSPSISAFSPSVSTFPSYDTSEKTYRWDQGISAKTKWYQRKSFKYPFMFLGTSIFLDNYLEQQQYQSILNQSDDVAEKDPELYVVMLQIKKDLGITNKINFRIWHKPPFEDFVAEFKIGRKMADNPLPEIPCTVLLTPDYKLLAKPELIHTIAHELEHARQHLQYLGSYHARDSSSDVRIKKRETAADAAAADYQNCSECLKEIVNEKKINLYLKHNPRDTEHGYFTTEYGYFSPEDYRLWIDRACEDDAMCRAHRDRTHENPNTPLKDYLPQIVK